MNDILFTIILLRWNWISLYTEEWHLSYCFVVFYIFKYFSKCTHKQCSLFCIFMYKLWNVFPHFFLLKNITRLISFWVFFTQFCSIYCFKIILSTFKMFIYLFFIIKSCLLAVPRNLNTNRTSALAGEALKQMPTI